MFLLFRRLVVFKLFVSIFLFNTAYAGWWGSEDTEENDRANRIIKECVQILQKKLDNEENRDIKFVVYPGDYKILSENKILMKIIILGDRDNYVSKQENEGVCSYIPDSKSILWQPIL